MRALRDDLVHGLASASARADLVKQLHDFLHFRTNSHPLKYEQDPQFRKGLDKTYVLFVKALHSFNSSRLRSLDLEEFATVAFQAYGDNSALFESFVATNNAPTDLVPQRQTTPEGGVAAPTSPQVIRQGMLTFSLIVYAADRKQWNTANQSSHFWPWCRAKE